MLLEVCGDVTWCERISLRGRGWTGEGNGWGLHTYLFDVSLEGEKDKNTGGKGETTENKK